MFRRYDGTFDFDEDDITKTKVAVTVDMASVDMFHDGMNKHLRR